jgi:hypothetical protein
VIVSFHFTNIFIFIRSCPLTLYIWCF